MAVEARHLNLFSPQLLGNRELMNPIEASMNLYTTAHHHNGYNSSLLPLSGITTATEAAPTALLPAAYNSLVVDSVPDRKTPPAIKSDSSGLTSYNYKINANSLSFLGEDISLQIQQQQLDIDRLIAQHMDNVRMELEEKRKRQARRVIEAIEAGMMKRLRAKEEEIAKIGKLNWALEEKVKSLCVENQIWRELAQTNEATANALRTNLEQVLAQATVVPAACGCAAAMDDAESCCGSSGGGDDEEEDSEGWRRIAKGGAKDKDGEEGRERKGIMRRLCRKCGKGESCVLILPCRHLCLCTMCGSSLHTCPICKSFKTASVHVNMS
ncbi:putative BOI-related E3 ubiquitin-protein ligase 3 [Senna tora]|uniref:RING-type E3 ubiquitin transferase n=1 Tax=Senna tora TaxID=362788 RepID=A0A834WY39_9FABA|nr:putative BOI-related E3 ubiquitin-protein ligase 3 [Senna tora]